MRVTPFADRFGGVVIAHEDITDRKRVEHDLQWQTVLLRLLEGITTAANQAISVEAAMQSAIEQICTTIGWPVGHAYLTSDNGAFALGATRLWYTENPEQFALFRKITDALTAAIPDELPHQVLLTGQPCWNADITTDPAMPRARLISNIGVRASFAFPVLVGAEVVAVLEFFSTEVSEPDNALLEVMAHIGTQLGRVVERQRADTAIRRSERLYRALASNFPNGAVLLFDHDLRYSIADGAGLTWLGLARELIEGKLIWQVHPPLECETLETEYRAALNGMPSIKELQHYERYFVVHTLPVKDEKGDIIGGMVMTQEITERKRVEQELFEERELLTRRVTERTVALSAANAELARAARLKDEFLASMSHELRTPMNAILGLSEALQEAVYGPLNERQNRTLQAIEESGRHLLELINDILDLAKIDAGKMDFQREWVAIEPLCQASMRMIQQAASKKRLNVTLVCDPNLRQIKVDARRLKQILVNLLSNAVKFTLEGGSIGLDIDTDQERHVVRFTVWDTGIGIEPDQIEQLFKPFVQLDSRLAREYAGTGLGLALVYRMVELHGGSVAVASEPGLGSRFTVSLPMVSELPEVQPMMPVTRARAVRRALIIEDSATAGDQLVRYLNEQAIESTVRSWGSEGLKYAREMQPDVIFLDVLLPDMSGWEILRRLKNELSTRAIPVAVISVIDDRPQAVILGASDYLVKPVTRTDIQRFLNSMVPTEQAQSSPAPFTTGAFSQQPIILLAEDNEANITTISDYLTAQGYQVITARNGNEAVAQAYEIRPDLILMDIQMPGMDGLEATRRLRADSELASIPIIALTALAMPGDRERCLAVGANDYLSKPVSLKGLASTLLQHLNPTTFHSRGI
jgi:PAS domain S-box-containing protein